MTTKRLEELFRQIIDSARSLYLGGLEAADANAVYYSTSKTIAELEAACRQQVVRGDFLDRIVLIREAFARLAGLRDAARNSPDEIYDLLTGEIINLQWDMRPIDWDPPPRTPESKEL